MATIHQVIRTSLEQSLPYDSVRDLGMVDQILGDLQNAGFIIMATQQPTSQVVDGLVAQALRLGPGHHVDAERIKAAEDRNAATHGLLDRLYEHWRKTANHRMLSNDEQTAAEGRAMIALLQPFVSWAKNEMAAGHALKPAVLAFAESMGLVLALMCGMAAEKRLPAQWMEVMARAILVHAQRKYDECATLQGAH